MIFKKQNSNKKINAFTLAEVLITLGIIGVVAALTIPALLQKNQDKVIVSQLKKAHSILSSAYNMAVQENGSPETWGITGAAYSGTASEDMMVPLLPYLNIDKDCGLNTGQGCMQSSYKYTNAPGSLSIDGAANYYKVRLKDGMGLTATYDGNNCSNQVGPTPALQTECGGYGVDVNGDEGPNQVGADYFLFFLTRNGILPKGLQIQTADSLFSNRCVGGTPSYGSGCTAWVMYNENLDYLRCPSSLSWATNHSCP